MAIAEPIIIDPIADIAATSTSPNREIPLFDTFDDPFTTGLVARFELFNTDLGDNGGITEVLLFDQDGRGAPLAVANFLTYVEDDDYVNSIIHRSVPGFVIQGGGFIADGLDEIIAQDGDPADAISLVPTDPPIINEFSSDRSNLAGTIAMAKLGGDPDSATSQWFFNLGDNSANLDTQNDGFTFFGEVRSAADLSTVEAIAAVPTPDGADAVFRQSAFADQQGNGTLPLIDPDPSTPDIVELVGDENFVRYSNITLVQTSELAFEVVGNTNPDAVSASIEGDRLVLDYAEDTPGTAEITVRATNWVGATVEDTFAIATTSESNPLLFGDVGDNEFSAEFAEDFDGAYLFSGAGSDRIDLGSTGNPDRIYSGSGNDEFFAGTEVRFFAGEGNDAIDAAEGGGNNRLYGQAGDDDFFLGSSDRVAGGTGSDRFFVLAGGNNTLSGGAGADEFWIANAELPEAANAIADFTPGTDIIGISGLEADFDQLDRQGNTLSLEGRPLAILLGIDTASLSATDFIFE